MSASDRERDYSAAHDYPDSGSDEKIDSILYGLMEILERAEGDGGVSLLVIVPGGAIKGTLVSRRTWYKTWISSINKAESVAPLGAILNAIHQSVGKLSEDGSILDHGVTYLHLIDGALIDPRGATNSMPWRIRLDQVSGWSLGGSAPS